MPSELSGEGKPFMTPWKVAVVVAVLGALGNGGGPDRRIEQRSQNYEWRIRELERNVREFQGVIAKLKAEAEAKAGKRIAIAGAATGRPGA
jgi:hypothetical protein